MDKNQCLGEDLSRLRQAMQLLVRVFDQARVPWKNEDAYDGWDRVAEALFQTLVVDAVLEDGQLPSSMPRYEFTYQNYSQFDVVPAILLPNDCLNVFHSFHTRSQPFDAVKYVRVDKPTGELVSTHLIDWEQATFVWQKM